MDAVRELLVMNAPRRFAPSMKLGCEMHLRRPKTRRFLDGAAMWMKCSSSVALHTTAVVFVSLKWRCKIKMQLFELAIFKCASVQLIRLGETIGPRGVTYASTLAALLVSYNAAS